MVRPGRPGARLSEQLLQDGWMLLQLRGEALSRRLAAAEGSWEAKAASASSSTTCAGGAWQRADEAGAIFGGSAAGRVQEHSHGQSHAL